jgi:hypothetical protein
VFSILQDYPLNGSKLLLTISRVILLEAIARSHLILFLLFSEIGLFVLFAVCDLGPCNQAFGISCDRNKVPHPSDSSKSLYLLPDVPHDLKNICNTFVKGDNFVFNDSLVGEFALQSNVINIDPVKDIFVFQENEELKS